MRIMRLATAILTGFLVLGLIWVFWPFGSSDDTATTGKSRSGGQDGRLFTAPLRTQPAPEKTETAKTAESAAIVDAQTPTEKRLFYRVTVRDGGTLQAGQTLITLDGISGLEAGTRCKDANGRDWPCGTQARAALVRLIRGRAVRCDVPRDDPAVFSARCMVGGTDLALWMVRHGWAKPEGSADETLAQAAETARASKAGLWR